MAPAKFSDLEEELNVLGFGSQWEAQIDELAMRRKKVEEDDLARLKAYRAKNPEKIEEARKRRRRKNKERFGYLSGTECTRCCAVLKYESIINGKCNNCSEELHERPA